MSASKSHQVFWPYKARLVISISVQFETELDSSHITGTELFVDGGFAQV